MILILLLVFIQYVSTFNTNVNIPLNIFTIKSDDIKINNIFSFTDYDLEENKLELDKSMNIERDKMSEDEFNRYRFEVGALH